MLDFFIGLELFQGIEWWVLLALAATHALGCFIRGAFGFGSNVPIVVISAFLLPPHHAILLALMTTIAAQIQLIPAGIRTADWQVTKPLMAGLVVGTGFGSWLFSILSPQWLVIILGAVIVFIILMDTIKIIEKMVRFIDLRSKPLASLLAVIGGLMGGLSGAGAFYFLVVYLKHACPTPTSLRGTNVMLATLTMSIRLISLGALGFLTPTLIFEGLTLWPIALIGTWLGTKAFQKSNPAGFYFALQIVLLAGAASLIYKGFQQLG
jgi:uncharacterized membrane protein YfcA